VFVTHLILRTRAFSFCKFPNVFYCTGWLIMVLYITPCVLRAKNYDSVYDIMYNIGRNFMVLDMTQCIPGRSIMSPCILNAIYYGQDHLRHWILQAVCRLRVGAFWHYVYITRSILRTGASRHGI
jgi:hypothetical protein